MKFPALLAALLLSAAASAQADILIYGGFAPARELGLISAVRREREIFIVDTDNQLMQRIHTGVMGRQRVFSVGNVKTIHIIQPIFRRHDYTVISQAETSTGNGTDFTTQSLYLRGVNTRVRIAAGATGRAPRMLGGSDRTVVQDNTQASAVEQNFAVALNEVLTVAANSAHESVTDATNRVVISLQNAGYKGL